MAIYIENGTAIERYAFRKGDKDIPAFVVRALSAAPDGFYAVVETAHVGNKESGQFALINPQSFEADHKPKPIQVSASDVARIREENKAKAKAEAEAKAQAEAEAKAKAEAAAAAPVVPPAPKPE